MSVGIYWLQITAFRSKALSQGRLRAAPGSDRAGPVGSVSPLSGSSDLGGGDIEGGEAPRHHPAGDAPVRSAGDHPQPSRRRLRWRPHYSGEDEILLPWYLPPYRNS